MLRSMWLPTLRARRRRGDSTAPGKSRATVTDIQATLDPLDAVLEDAVLTMGSHELDRLRQALQRLLGTAVDRHDTPARIERALALFLTDRHAPGRPRVLRRPAVIMAPESWEICLDGTDRRTVTAIRDASRTGRFA
jgi:predicted NBD/HSP70 family sugar kinase